jgi:hypothetical protein
VQPTLEAGEQDAEPALARLATLGIDLGAITEKLLADGITAFTHSSDELLASLKEKRSVLLESQVVTTLAKIRFPCRYTSNSSMARLGFRRVVIPIVRT